MEAITITPASWDVDYHGRFEDHRFGILANPIPAYEALLKHLADEGATLESLRIDAAAVASANISCTLTGATVRFRINRLEVSVSRWREPGLDVAGKILRKTWAALHEADPAAVVAEHTLDLRLWGRVTAGSYHDLVGRYLTSVATLPAQTGVGLTFYQGPDEANGRRSGTISVDGFAGSQEWTILKANGTFSAGAVPIEHAAERFKVYFMESIAHLGIQLGQETA